MQWEVPWWRGRVPVATESSSLEGTFQLSYLFGLCFVEESVNLCSYSLLSGEMSTPVGWEAVWSLFACVHCVLSKRDTSFFQQGHNFQDSRSWGKVSHSYVPPGESTRLSQWSFPSLSPTQTWKCVNSISLSSWWDLECILLLWTENPKYQGWALPHSLWGTLFAVSLVSGWLSCESTDHQEPAITINTILGGILCFVTCCSIESFHILATGWAILFHACFLSSWQSN